MLRISNLSNDIMDNPAALISGYERELEKTPNDENILLKIWSTMYVSSMKNWSGMDTEKIMTYFDKVLWINPENEDALFYKILLLVNDWNYNEANNYYQKLSQINPDNEDLSFLKEKIDFIKK